jgi:hypothetical protein
MIATIQELNGSIDVVRLVERSLGAKFWSFHYGVAPFNLPASQIESG